MNETTGQKENGQTRVALFLITVLLVAIFLLGDSMLAAAGSMPDQKAEVRVNDIRAQWDETGWQYSADNGETWTDDAPEGFITHEDNSLTIQQHSDSPRYDVDAWEQSLDNWFVSLREEVDRFISDALPEGHQEGGSYVRFGETIARQIEAGQWEFSGDGGKTWTDEAPEGVSVNEGGTGLVLGDEAVAARMLKDF